MKQKTAQDFIEEALKTYKERNKTYGDNTADNLITMSRQIKKYTNQDLLDLIDHFEKLV